MRTFEDDLADPPGDLLCALIAYARSEYSTIYVKHGDARALRALRIRFEELARGE